jgi:acyl-coenzyme A synthetase/AMP-(fatty) acid ligase
MHMEAAFPSKRSSSASICTLPICTRMFVRARDTKTMLAALQLAQHQLWQLLIVPSDWSDERVSEMAQQWRPYGGIEPNPQLAEETIVRLTGHPLAPIADAGAIVFTSGTTGVPKAVLHDWARLRRSARFAADKLPGRTWFVSYEPGSFAGLQVCLAALQGNGKLVAPTHRLAVGDQARMIVEERVEAISGTPTWWRMLLASWPADIGAPKLEQATIGGECVDQGLLNALEELFHPARMTHIYASSEAGTTIAVSDRKAGFPASLLERNDPGRAQFRIVGGVLHVRSELRMRGYVDDVSGELRAPEEWIDTGDLVEVRGDRCFFVGRRDQRLNVGGRKIAAEEVERALLRYEDISDCLVYAEKSPIVGMILVADVVPRCPQAFDLKSFSSQIRRDMSRHLVPQYVRVVDRIEVSANGKKQRA